LGGGKNFKKERNTSKTYATYGKPEREGNVGAFLLGKREERGEGKTGSGPRSCTKHIRFVLLPGLGADLSKEKGTLGIWKGERIESQQGEKNWEKKG